MPVPSQIGVVVRIDQFCDCPDDAAVRTDNFGDFGKFRFHKTQPVCEVLFGAAKSRLVLMIGLNDRTEVTLPDAKFDHRC